MDGRKLLLMAGFLLLGLSLVGCLGGNRGAPNYTFSGAITGTVIDDTGKGLPGVRVVIPNSPLATTTDARGTYTLYDVPDGTWPLLATKQGYRVSTFPMTMGVASADLLIIDDVPHTEVTAMANEVAAQLYTTATVSKGSRVVAPTIRLIQYEASGDDVAVTKMSLPAYSVLQAGEERTLDLDVFYTLKSAANALIVASLRYGSVPLGADALPISTGTQTAQLRVPFTVPHAPSVTLQIVMFDEYGMLAAASQTLFRIEGYKTPKAPRLVLDRVDPTAIVLSWSTDDLVNFGSLKIYRAESNLLLIGPSYGDLVAEITDPTVTTFIDSDFFFGETLYYMPYFETRDGQVLNGPREEALAVQTAPMTWTSIPMGNDPVQTLITNPAYNQVYALMGGGNVVIASSASQSIERTISAGCRSAVYALSDDGSQLFVPCTDTNRIAIVALPAGDVTYIEDIGRPTRVAYDAATTSLYVAARHNQGMGAVKTLRIQLQTGEREDMPIGVHGGMIVLPGDLLVTKAFDIPDPVVVYDMNTWEAVHTWDDVTHYVGTLHRATLSPDGSVLYAGTSMFSLPDGRWLGHIGRSIDATNGDGSLLFGAWGSEITVYKSNGHTWTPFVRLTVPSNVNTMAISEDSRTLYVGTTREILFVDISELN